MTWASNLLSSYFICIPTWQAIVSTPHKISFSFTASSGSIYPFFPCHSLLWKHPYPNKVPSLLHSSPLDLSSFSTFRHKVLKLNIQPLLENGCFREGHNFLKLYAILVCMCIFWGENTKLSSDSPKCSEHAWGMFPLEGMYSRFKREVFCEAMVPNLRSQYLGSKFSEYRKGW